uniref:Uncharacterized protein n=1 Tax=Anguilla anguilla TaxID=7936 RepID=A0A0E9WF12_ANGAN
MHTHTHTHTHTPCTHTHTELTHTCTHTRTNTCANIHFLEFSPKRLALCSDEQLSFSSIFYLSAPVTGFISTSPSPHSPSPRCWKRTSPVERL